MVSALEPWRAAASVRSWLGSCSSLLFIVLGVAFIVFQGSNAFGGLYAALGASDLALQIESGVRDLAVRAPLVLVLVVGVPVAGLVIAAARTLRRPDDPYAEPAD